MSGYVQVGRPARPSGPRSHEPQPLRLLHVLAPASYGGLERVVQSLCIGLRRRSHAVHVAVVTEHADVTERFQAPLAAVGVHVHPLILPPRAYFQEHRTLARLCAALTPDVVHTHGHRPDILAAWAARAAGVPTVATVHGFTGGDWKLRLYERAQRVALRRFDAVVAVSRTLAERLAGSGVPWDRVHVIPNCWHELDVPLGRAAARRALGLPPNGNRIIGWVGRLSHEKGPDVMVETLAALRDLPVTVAFVGDGPERSHLERTAEKLGLTGRIHWCGSVPNSSRLFSAFDVYVLSSRTEGTPMVLFEAMAARTPIVATAVGGVPDVLPRGTALVVEAENPEALARAVRDVLISPRHATARATTARTRLLTRYEPERWLDAYEVVYRRVCRPAVAAPS